MSLLADEKLESSIVRHDDIAIESEWVRDCGEGVDKGSESVESELGSSRNGCEITGRVVVLIRGGGSPNSTGIVILNRFVRSRVGREGTVRVGLIRGGELLSNTGIDIVVHLV
jgi:hypothetical protein